MTEKITESAIEKFTIELLEKQGKEMRTVWSRKMEILQVPDSGREKTLILVKFS